MLKYTDITQNTYVQSWTVTEIWHKCINVSGEFSASIFIVEYLVTDEEATTKHPGTL